MTIRKKNKAQTQGKLKRSTAETLYLSLFNQSPDAIFLLDLDGKYQQVNARAAELLGYEPAEIIDLPRFGLISNPDLGAAIMQRLIQGETIRPFEQVFRKKNGGLLAVEVHPSLIRDTDGSPIYILSTARDISARKQAETTLLSAISEREAALENLRMHQIELSAQNEELRASQEKLRASQVRYFDLYNLAPASYISINMQGQILESNLSAALLLGQNRGKLTRQPFSRFILPEDQDIFYLLRKQLIQTGEQQRCDLRLLKRDGAAQIVWAHLEATVAQTDLPDTQIIHIIINDISERKQAEAALLEAEASKREQEALRKSNQLLSAFIQHSPIYTFIKQVTASESRILLVSENFHEMLGIPSREMVGKNMAELFPAEFAAAITADDWAVVSAGNVLKLDEELNGRSYTTIKFPIFHESKNLLAGYTIDVTERKRIEDAQHENDEKYRTVADFTYDWEAWRGPDGAYRYISPSCKYITGHTAEEFMADPNLTIQITHPDDQAAVSAHYHRIDCEAPEEDIEFDFRIISPDGELHWLAHSCTAVHTQDGRYLGRRESTRDITDRKWAEQTLLENEEKFRFITETSPVGMYFFQLKDDDRLILTGANPSADRIIGIDHQELLNKTIEQCFPAMADTEIPTLFRKIASGELGPQFFETAYKDKRVSGYYEIRAFQTSANNIALNFLDVSERKLAEDELRRITSRLSLATRAGGIGIWDYDVVNNTLVWDEQMFHLYGSPPEALMWTYEAWLAVLHPNDRQKIDQEVKLALHGEKELDTEFRIIWPDGSLHYLRALGIAQHDDSGLTTHLIGTNYDITERSQAEQVIIDINLQLEEAILHANALAVQAQAATVAKSRFLANMSHEIRTPLNAILGFSQLLQADSDELSEQQKKRVVTINRSGEHLLALLNSILEISKIEEDRESLALVTFDLQTLLGDLTLSFRAKAEAQHLSFEIDGMERLPRYIIADDLKLRQILINLLGNAIKFTKTGGVRFRIWVEPNGQQDTDDLRLIALVEDSGPGIASEEMGKLFKAFEQTSTGRHTDEGTGLGLFISRQFARLMGGDVTVNSATGQGSIFRLEIPVKASIATLAADKIDQRHVLRIQDGCLPCKVLIVDDQEENRSLLNETLSVAGFELQDARNGLEAVSIFSSWHPELILMDLRMPEMDGDEAIRQIRQSPGGNQVKIVTITANATDETRKETLAAGADDFMAKPFHQNELLEKIRLLTGIRYIYTETSQSVESVTKPPALTREITETLPAEFKQQIREAAIRGRHDYLLGLVEQFASIDPQISAQLRDIIARFDYETLMQLCA